jgi:hypothetical protein
MKIVLRKTEDGLRAYVDGKKHTTPFTSPADFAEFAGVMMHFGVWPKDATLAYHNGLVELPLTPTYEYQLKERPRILHWI